MFLFWWILLEVFLQNAHDFIFQFSAGKFINICFADNFRDSGLLKNDSLIEVFLYAGSFPFVPRCKSDICTILYPLKLSGRVSKRKFCSLT